MERDPLHRLAVSTAAFSVAAGVALWRPEAVTAAVVAMVVCQAVGLSALWSLARERGLVAGPGTCPWCDGEHGGHHEDCDLLDGWPGEPDDTAWMAGGWPVPRDDGAARPSWWARRRLVRDVERFLQDHDAGTE